MQRSNPLQQALRSYYQNKLRAARLLTVEELARTAVIFAPHPDDESLGCGGTIFRKKEAGAAVKVVFMTDGSASHPGLMAPEKLREIRMKEGQAACAKLGLAAEDIFFLDFHDMYLTTCIVEAEQKVTALLAAIQPEEVFVPFPDDPQLDHRAAYRVVSDSIQRLGRPITVNTYAIWHWYHWPWVAIRQGKRGDTIRVIKRTIRTAFGMRGPGRFNVSVDIQPVLERKRAALYEHRSQMTRLVQDVHWPTLEDVSRGEFLARFFQDREYFYRYSANTPQ